MSGEYFDKLPEIRYNNVLVRDITRRVNFVKQAVENPYVILPYTIKEGERAEDIAFYYYGNPNYVWIVYLANNIIDPYNEWPLDEDTFNNYIMDKYKEQSGREGWDVVAWAQDETRDDNVVYYYKEV
jgi:hypothetical protein